MNILKVLKSRRVVCRWWCDKRYAGENMGHLIRINPKYDIVPSIIHEVTHLLHPDWKEEKVKKYEEMSIKRLTKRQAVSILKAFTKKAR